MTSFSYWNHFWLLREIVKEKQRYTLNRNIIHLLFTCSRNKSHQIFKLGSYDIAASPTNLEYVHALHDFGLLVLHILQQLFDFGMKRYMLENCILYVKSWKKRLPFQALRQKKKGKGFVQVHFAIYVCDFIRNSFPFPCTFLWRLIFTSRRLR